MKKAVVVLPTYNEAGNIKRVIDGIFDSVKGISDWEVSILVVDSTSEDKTAEIVRDLQNTHKHLHLLETKKEGLGKAYVHGFSHAIHHMNADLLFEMDADLSHNPKDIPAFIKKIDEGYDFVIGSRYIKGGYIPDDWGIHRKIFSSLGNIIIRLGFMNLKIHEWTNGFRAIRTPVIKRALSHIANYPGYVFQIAMLDHAIKYHAHITEIPIKFKERESGKSKINFGQYIFNILSYIFFHSSFVKFVIVGGTGFIIDSTILWVLVHMFDFLPTFAKIVSAESAIISNYTLNNFWSFSHKKLNNTLYHYLRGLVKFNIVSSGNIIIQTIGITILTHLFGTELIVLFNALIIFVFVIPYSYFFYNKFIWKDNKKTKS